MINYSDDIKRAVSMKDVCNEYGIEIKKGGFALCPWHTDRRPSLKIYDGSRGCHCFSCQKGGSVIDFTMQYFNLSFFDACAKLNTDFCLNIPIGEKLSKEERRKADEEARKRREERDRIAQEGDMLSKRYHVTLDSYTALDRALTANKPRSVDEITKDYALALQQMPIAKYNLEQAEIALYNFEHRNDA